MKYHENPLARAGNAQRCMVEACWSTSFPWLCLKIWHLEKCFLHYPWRSTHTHKYISNGLPGFSNQYLTSMFQGAHEAHEHISQPILRISIRRKNRKQIQKGKEWSPKNVQNSKLWNTVPKSPIVYLYLFPWKDALIRYIYYIYSTQQFQTDPYIFSPFSMVGMTVQ